jgi:hypothetical protein
MNLNLMPSNQVSYIGWCNERIYYSNNNWSCWNRVLLGIKGVDCYLFENYDIPQSVDEWNEKTNRIYRIYESLFKKIKVFRRVC